MNHPLNRRRAISSSALLFASSAFAQSEPNEAQLAEATLPAVVVMDTTQPSLTSQTVGEQRRKLYETAGSGGFVGSESYASPFAFPLRDVLENVPRASMCRTDTARSCVFQFAAQALHARFTHAG